MPDSNRLKKSSCSDSEEKYRLLIRKIRTAIVLHDGQGRILDSNPMAQELLGLSAEQLAGRSLIDPEWHFLREDGSVLPVAEYPASLVLSSRLPLRDYVTGISRPDRNAVRWVLVNGEPEYADDGEIAQVIVSFVDITERRRMEDALFFVAQRGWLAGAENFFDALAQYLGENLNVDYVVIDRIDENPDIAVTVALYAKGAIVPNMRYALKGTPCENVMGQRLCVYPQDVQRLFPEDTLLAEMGVESYIGIPLWDSSGRPTGLIALMNSKPLPDTASATQLLQLVATRAAAELARERSDRILRTREHEFRTLAENLPDNIIRYDREGRTVYVNPALEKTLGAAAADMIGKHFREFHPDGSYEAYTEALEAALASGENSEMEFILPIPGKDPIVHQIRMIAERDDHGEVTGVLTIGRDITERKRMEEEHSQNFRDLHRLTNFQRTILDNAAYGIISTTPEGIVTSFNPAAERVLGYTADELVGTQTPACWHDPEEVARHALRLSGELDETITPGFEVFAARARRNLPEENEWTFIRKDGTRVPVLMSVTALWDENGQITGFVGMGYDLTERKRAEEALHLQKLELEEEVAERQVAQENLQEKALLLEEEIEKRQKAQVELEKLNEKLEQRVKQRTKELEEKNNELHTMNRLFVGRELKMVELKERIRELEGDKK
ncbi:MAG: PAS domain S-box protein [Pelobacteraceae bacterium]